MYKRMTADAIYRYPNSRTSVVDPSTRVSCRGKSDERRVVQVVARSLAQLYSGNGSCLPGLNSGVSHSTKNLRTVHSGSAIPTKNKDSVGR